MLVLSRRVGEEVVIGDDIQVVVVAVHGDRVRLGVSAPREVVVDRQEVHARRAHPAGQGAALAPTPSGPPADSPLAAREGHPRL